MAGIMPIWQQLKQETTSKDEKIRKLLLSNNEEDLKVATAMMAKKNVIKEGLYAFEDVEFWEERMCLQRVRDLQKRYPELIFTGSIALFFHGVRLKRWESEHNNIDFDIVLPYWVELRDKNGNLPTRDFTVYGDFDEQMYLDEGKVDIKIDNKQSYEHITYNNYTYKVAPFLGILEAKIKYAQKPGGGKHYTDIAEMIGKITFSEYLAKVEKANAQLTI